MDDMTAFERLVAGRIEHHAGPIRPVDDAAILDEIVATRSPTWTITPLFGVAKLVAASAIVALFGALLLAGVLTMPTEEQAPAVGASASPSVEPTGGPGSFRPAGTMSEPRARHTATLLADGRVLVVGGVRDLGRGDPAPSAEIWDPATESFEPAGALVEARSGHTATLLDDGRVLIGGAWSEQRALVELWDPTTGSFEPGGRLGPPEWQTATRLLDGRVLAVGQEGSLPPKAFVWDPATESIARVDGPPVLGPRRTATLLADGRVLIVGGGDTFSALTWDPVTESFEPAGHGWAIRREHAATLLADGRVLLTGGIDNRSKSILASAQVWDPASESFDATGSLSDARDNHTATLLSDGRVLVVGGNYAEAFTSTEIWDPATSAFEPGASLAEGRDHHTATRLADGRVLVIGGRDEDGALASAEIWEPGDGTSRSNLTDDEDAANPDILPGVDVVTEEVEPGVYRVLSDGVRDLSRRQGGSGVEMAIVAGLDGSIWRFGLDGFFRIGDPVTHAVPESLDDWGYGDELEIGPDGTVWRGSRAEGLTAFDGQTWSLRRAVPEGGSILGVAVQEDGTVWTAWRDAEGRGEAARLTDDGWEVLPGTVPDARAGRDGYGKGLLVTRETGGDVWLTGDDALYRHTGDDWEVKLLAGREAIELIRADAVEKGSLWTLEVGTEHPFNLGHMEGAGGSLYSLPVPEGGGPYPGFDGFFVAGPKGGLWRSTECDGVRGRGAHLRGQCVYAMDVAPDGSVWLQAGAPRSGPTIPVDTYVYVITPDAGAAADPDEVTALIPGG